MESIRQALITLHGLDPEANDDAILAAVKGAKILNDQTKADIKTGVLNELSTFQDFEALPNRFKKDVKANLKGAAYEMREDEIIEKYGLDAKRGEDFTDMFGLIELAIAKKGGAKPTEEVERLQTELKTERKTVAELQAAQKAQYDKGLADGLGKSVTFAKEAAINSIASSLVDAKQLDPVKGYLGYEFDNGFDVDLEGNQHIVIDKETKRPVLGDDGKPKSLGQVFTELAKEKTSLEFANKVPNGGRGGSKKAPSGNEPTKADEIAKSTEEGESPFTADNYKAMEEKADK